MREEEGNTKKGSTGHSVFARQRFCVHSTYFTKSAVTLGSPCRVYGRGPFTCARLTLSGKSPSSSPASTIHMPLCSQTQNYLRYPPSCFFFFFSGSLLHSLSYGWCQSSVMPKNQRAQFLRWKCAIFLSKSPIVPSIYLLLLHYKLRLRSVPQSLSLFPPFCQGRASSKGERGGNK